MISKLVWELLKNKWVWVAVAAVAVSFYVYAIVQQNKELRFQLETRRQNEVALQDSVSKMKDSVQVLAVSIKDLQSETVEWKNKYIATTTRYQIALNTITVWKRVADSLKFVGDSIAIVEFSGKEGIATYRGRTEANIKTNVTNHSLAISFSDIETESSLFYDEADSLWKIRTVSLSPGITLRGISAIDSDTFRKIRGLKTAVEKRTPKILAIGGFSSYDRVYGGLIISPSRWMFSIHYKVFEKYLEDERWSDKLMIGVHYYIW